MGSGEAGAYDDSSLSVGGFMGGGLTFWSKASRGSLVCLQKERRSQGLDATTVMGARVGICMYPGCCPRHGKRGCRRGSRQFTKGVYKKAKQIKANSESQLSPRLLAPSPCCPVCVMGSVRDTVNISCHLRLSPVRSPRSCLCVVLPGALSRYVLCT